MGGFLASQLWVEDYITHICIQHTKWEKEVVMIANREGAESA